MLRLSGMLGSVRRGWLANSYDALCSVVTCAAATYVLSSATQELQWPTSCCQVNTCLDCEAYWSERLLHSIQYSIALLVNLP
jgi:hypothetical protein